MKIILDEKMQAYISRYMLADISEIYLDSDSNNIQHNFLSFLEALIQDRTWSAEKLPYKYDRDRKQLFIYKRDSLSDSADFERQFEEIVKSKGENYE